jgi:hypothetical protein
MSRSDADNLVNRLVQEQPKTPAANTDILLNALRWIVANPAAHPANMVKVAQEAVHKYETLHLRRPDHNEHMWTRHYYLEGVELSRREKTAAATKPRHEWRR